MGDQAGHTFPSRVSSRLLIALLCAICLILLLLELHMQHNPVSLAKFASPSNSSTSDPACEPRPSSNEILDLRTEVSLLNFTKEHIEGELELLAGRCRLQLNETRVALIEELANTTIQLKSCQKYVREHDFAVPMPLLPINNDDYTSFTLPLVPPYNEKPRVAIVVGFDSYAVHHFGKQLASLSCYAALHDIPIHLEFYPLHTDRVPNRGRLRAYLKYLAYYQWIVSFDADTIVLDYSKSFEEHLDDRYDVILMERGYEVTSSHVAFRASQFSVRFIKDWMEFASKRFHKKNTDNGDLLDLLFARFFPAEEVPDRGFKLGDDAHWGKYGVFKERFHELFFRNLSNYWPIRIFRSEEGFMNHRDRTGMFNHVKEVDISEDQLYCRTSLVGE